MGTRLAVSLAASVLLLACGDDARPATFEYIHASIIAPNCTTSGCHSDLAQVAGINLDSLEDAYLELTGSRCGDEGAQARHYVTPGQPENSQLMYLVLGIEVARPMPPDVPLPDGEIDLIERWILEGAPCR